MIRGFISNFFQVARFQAGHIKVDIFMYNIIFLLTYKEKLMSNALKA